MKNIYAKFAFIIIANAVSINAFSQAIIFTQNFDTVWTTPNTLSPSWSGTTIPSNNQWHKNTYTTGWSSSGGAYSPAGANNTSASARFHSFDSDINSIGELITPSIDFSNYSNNKRFVFYLTNASGIDKVDVYLSLNGGASYGLSLGTFVLSGTGYWSLYSLDLGNINSSNVKIKFTATSDFGTSDIGIDEVFIYDGIPLNGIKSIDAFGDYSSFKTAIEDLNKLGVGPGGITFNVTSNQTFTEDLPILSVSGTVLNPIVFQRSGSGNNPVIKPTGGTGTADFGFALVGADYVTINGIDININSGNAVEYGYLIKNINPADGAQNNTIRNTNIILNKTNTASIGILQSTSSLSSEGYANVPSLTTGTNHSNKYFNLSIQNVYKGIYLVSGSSALPDNGNQIGVIDNGATIIGSGGVNNIGNGTQAAWGIRTFAQRNLSIFNCEIKNVTCTGINSVDGIFVDNNSISSVTTDTTKIFNNKIINLLNSNSSSTSHRVYGIRVNNPSNISSHSRIYNNFIFGLNNASANTTSRQVIGILAQESGNGLNSTHNILFNSVRLSPAGISSQNTCLEIGSASGPVLKINNNIFANFTSAQSGNARHYCIITPSGNYPGNTGSFSDHNDLYIANSSNGFTGLTGTTNRVTLQNWKNAFTPNQDINSISQNPEFTSSTDLHISPVTITQLESGGMTGTGTDHDIDIDIRPGPSGSLNGGGTFPDIGADEFDGIPSDNTAPLISYALLQNSGSISGINFTNIAISDPSGVNDTAGSRPRIYYKRSGDINTFIDNTGTTGGWKYAEANNSGSPFDFTIDYSLLDGGVSIGNVIQYFVAAQDLASPPNVGIHSGTFSAIPADVNLTSSSFPVTGTINSYSIINIPLAGDYIISSDLLNRVTGMDIVFASEVKKVKIEVMETLSGVKGKQKTKKNPDQFFKKVKKEVDEIMRKPMLHGKKYKGPLYVKRNENPEIPMDAMSGVYSTITAAVEDLNLRGASSEVRFLLSDSLYENETLPLIINPWEGASGINKLTIKPNIEVNSIVRGSSPSAVFILNGSDYVTIDGSNSLIQNSVCPPSSAPKNLTLVNNNLNTASAVVWLQSNGNNGASNNIIKNCNIEGLDNISTLFGIGSGSSVISTNSFGINNNNNIYENNNISRTQYGIYSQGASSINKNSGTVISQNLINKTAPDNVQFCGIQIGFENDVRISENKIENLETYGTLTAIAVGLSATDIIITSTTGNEVTNALIENNIIDNIRSTDSLGFSAIGISVAYSSSGINTILNNMISGLNAYSSSPDFVSGIYTGGGSGTTKIYFNSVSLTGSRGEAAYPSFSLSAGGSPALTDIQNNILVNNQISTGSGKSYSIGFAYGNYDNLFSNTNDLFTSGISGKFSKVGGLQQNIGTDLISFGEWQSITGKDSLSKNIQPVFSSPYLHILSTDSVNILNLANKGSVLSVNSDIECNPRINSFPDIGADEFDGLENSPPLITYSALTNTNSISNRTLANVTIVDFDGIDTSSGLSPRIYFKKISDENNETGWKFAEANNNTSPFEFTIDYSLLTGVSFEDTIQYFVTAQDAASESTVSIQSGTFANVPASVALTSASFPIGGAINSYKINDAPTISYSALNNTNNITNRALAGVIISDSDGIDTSSGLGPRIYFKKFGDENTFNDNTNSSAGWKFSQANNNSSPFEFTIDYSLLTGVSFEDTIQYFVTAQDAASESTVSIQSGTFANVPASVALTSASFPIGGAINSYKINDAPTISYSALNNTNNITNRVLAGVIISDSDGIDTSSGLGPRIYFKKFGDENTFNDNTNSSAGWKFSQANNSISPFEFTVDYSLLSGVTPGDTIQYFVTAQDNTAEPTVSINSGSFASVPISVALNSASFPIGGAINSYKINDAPTISYSALTNTNSISNRALTGVNISDSDEIDTSSNASPRIYFKKFGDENAFNDNSSSTAGWKFSQALNNTSPFEFTIDYSLLSDVTPGDTIQYFVIAQDVASEPTVSINSGSFASIPVSVALTSTSFPIGGAINSYKINDAPTISYSALSNTNSISNRAITNVTIVDSDGINTSTGLRPRIYFKKFSDENNVTGWKFTQANNNTSPFEFTIDYSLLTSITYGDTIQYFVTAQDTAIEPSVSINSGTFASIPLSVSLTSAAFPIGGVINSYKINDAPIISYTALTNANNLSNRILTNVMITDSDGIDTTSAGRPRIYFKKKTDGNTLAGWKFTKAANSTSPFQFTIDYSLLPGINFGDTLQYFITAQDIGSEPAVTINSGTFASAPLSVSLTSAAFPIGGAINSYKINSAPLISYTVLTTTISLSNRVLSNVTITDSDGIDTTSVGRPRIYFKKKTDQNTLADWKFTKASNSTSPFQFTIDYSQLTSLTYGDTIQYFIIAQDIGSDPAVTINSGTFASVPVSVSLTAAAFPIGGTINSYKINSAPSISYMPLSNTNSISNRTLTNVIINDPDGVDVSPVLRPRIYFKKTTDLNTSAGWKFVKTNSSTSPFQFTIDHSLLPGITYGDTIQYFIVAQDLEAQPSVNINSGNFASAPASVVLTSASFPIGGVINTYRINSVPLISYTALTNTNNISNRVLSNVTITDPDGIDTTSAARPRIYFKKSTDVNTITGWKFTQADNSASPFQFTIDYSLLPGITSGDTIQYFIIAQDLANEPLVSINTGTFASAPVSVSLTSSAFPIGGVIRSYKINSAPAISYTALTNANDLSNRVLTNVTITDSDGIDTTSAARPRIYFKKSTDGNTNTGWKFTQSNNSASPFQFTIDYSQLSGITTDDTIQYFVIAQDLGIEPLVSINSGTFASTPFSVSLTSAAFPIGGVFNSYRINDAPSISYTALANTNNISNRILSNVTITDSNGVDTTLGARPRIYFKRRSDNNTISGWKFKPANNNTSPFQFTIDYSLLPGINFSDTIQYFITAQDRATVPSVSINSGTFASVPVSTSLTAAAFPIGGAINSYKINDAPSITYTALANTNSISNRTLSNVSIIDSDGINTSTGLRPRIYYKKASNENNETGWRFTQANNSSSPFEFTIDYTLLTGVAFSDTMQYFVTAQDLTAVPTVSINSGTFASIPVNVELTSAAFPISGAINSYKINDAISISYTALTNTNSITNRTLTGVIISDSDGIDTADGSRPRIYFKKSNAENTLSGWKFAQANNSTSPFEFTIDYTLLSGISNGDSIQYFITAQDNENEPSVGISSGIFAAAPASVSLTSAAFPIGGEINSYEITDTTIYNDVSAIGYAVDSWFEIINNQNYLALSNNTFAPKILLKNSGDSDQVIPFEITFIISGAKNYTSVMSDTISTGSTKTIIFDSTFIPDTSGTCNVLIYTSLANDQNRSNDTLRSSFTILENINYGSLQGYSYSNSTGGASPAPSQPEFCWKDTTGSIDLVNSMVNVHSEIFTGSLNDGYWKVVLPEGKKIRFFGVNYDTIRIGTNGIISFSEFDPVNINSKSPETGTPGNHITNAFYPLWMDQNWGTINPATNSNRISFKINGNQFVITFDNAPGISGIEGDYISYQVCIDVNVSPVSNSRLLVQFADTTNHRTGNLFISNYTGGSSQVHLVGLQNVSGTAGIQYRYLNPAYNIVSPGPLFDTLNKSMALQFGPDNTKLDHSCQSLNLAFRLEAIQLTRKDTVTVMLRMPSAPYPVIERKKVVYDTLTGSAEVPFTFAENGLSYFIFVSHRNSISTWSANPVTFMSNTSNYDFTTGLSKAFENNMTMVDGKASFLTGDIDSLKDSFVDVTDLILLQNEILNFHSGPYLISDLNYDGTVDVTDMLFVYNNNVLFVRGKSPAGAMAP